MLPIFMHDSTALVETLVMCLTAIGMFLNWVMFGRG